MAEHRLPNPDNPIDQEDRVLEHGDPNHPRTLGDFMNPTRTGSPSCIVFPADAARFYFKPGVIQLSTVLNQKILTNIYESLKRYATLTLIKIVA